MTAGDDVGTVPARRRRVVVAGHAGDVDVARAGCDDEDATVRIAALGALARAGALTADELVAALRDRDPGVRRRGVELAAGHHDVDLAGPLADDDASVVEMAAWSAGERIEVSDEVLERVVGAATGHPDPLVREAAAAALGAIGDERGLAAILRACDDKPAVRRRAVLALAPFDGVEVRAALRRALDDRDWQVRQAAEDVVRAAGLDDGELAGEDQRADQRDGQRGDQSEKR